MIFLVTSKAKKKITTDSSPTKKDKKKKKEPSITDVIAVELMEKANMSLDPKLKHEDSENSPEPATPPREVVSDELNIPTISEIKSSGNLHKKELSQLAELQSRIYEAKKKLKNLDSDDEKMSEENHKKVEPPPPPTRPSTVISLSAIKKAEKEIYIAPSFRKLVEKQKEDNERTSSRRHRSRSRERFRNRRDRDRSRSPRNRPSIHQRIGSRVVVASPVRKREPPPPKTRPSLNSVVAKNAGKNLLLRAVMEASKSTSVTKVDPKSKRNNIVVQVPRGNVRDLRRIRIDEEYVPEANAPNPIEAEYRPSRNMQTDDVDDGDVIYLSNVDEVDLDDSDRDEVRKSPQFVVTMEGMDKYDRESHSPTPPPVIRRKRNIKDRIGIRPGFEDKSTRQTTFKRKSEVVEEEEHESLKAYNKRSRVSPIKFDLTDDEDAKSQGSQRDRSREKSTERNGDKMNGDEQKKIKLETSRSFDHVPPLLSSVTVVEQPKPAVIKSKERCKFYPSCVNTNCAFYHPSLPCKMFPACKFGDTCAYIHPKCKFDLSCTRTDCNFSHTQITGATVPSLCEY